MTHTATPAQTATPAPACTGFPGACGAPADQPCEPGCPSRATDDYPSEESESTPVALNGEIAEYIGDGSAHAADYLPLPAVSILDLIAQAKRDGRREIYTDGLADAYQAVVRHRFKVVHSRLSGGSRVVDTWTGDSPAFVRDAECRDQARAANERNAEVFAARIDRDIAEGGL